jgi:hypothetical protein
MALYKKNYVDPGDPAAADAPGFDLGSTNEGSGLIPPFVAGPLVESVAGSPPAEPNGSSPINIFLPPDNGASPPPGGSPDVSPGVHDDPPPTGPAYPPIYLPPPGNGPSTGGFAHVLTEAFDDPLSLLKAGLDQLTLAGASEAAWPVESRLSNGMDAAAGAAQLISAMASFGAGSTAFNASPFAQAPDDAGSQAMLAAVSHS